MFKLLLSVFLSTCCLLTSHASGHWQQKADFGNFGRHRGAGMAIGNKIYAGTGHLNGDGSDEWYPDWWQYDAATNAWSQKADYPGNNGNGDQDIVTVSFDSVGYAGMGQLSGFSNFFKYDPTTNNWTQMSSPFGGSFNNTFPFRIGDYAYFPVLGSNTLYRYDPANDVWTLLNPLPFSVTFGFPSFSIEGKGYILNNGNLYEYDPATDSWTPKAPCPSAYYFRPHAVSQGGYGFVIGGAESPFNLWGTEVWRYQPSTDSWNLMHDFPGTARRWAVLVNLHDHIYYGLGTNGTNFNDWWEYQPTLSLDEEDIDLTIYPNPATDRVTISFTHSGEHTLRLLDLSGRTVHSENLIPTSGIQETIIDLSEISAGHYLLKVDGEGVSISKTLQVK